MGVGLDVFWDFEGGQVCFRCNLYEEVWQRLGIVKWLVGRDRVDRVVDCLVVGWPVGSFGSGCGVDRLVRVWAYRVSGEVFGWWGLFLDGLVVDAIFVLREWWLVRDDFKDEFARWRLDLVRGVSFPRRKLL